MFDRKAKVIYDYETITSEPTARPAKNINPYLVDARDVWIGRRSDPLCSVPGMVSGNQPIDDGNYLFTPEEKEEFLSKEPGASHLFRRWLGGDEFLNKIERWCLYVAETSPTELRKLPETMKRIEAVKKYRSKSNRASTKKLADTPTQFQVAFSANSAYIAMPEVSSERRQYIPVAYLTPEVLCSNKLRLVRNVKLFHFGILQSEMHMAWTRYTCGRLESRYQYSINIVYNNYPWPKQESNPSPSHSSPSSSASSATSAFESSPRVAAVESAAQAVLDARAKFPDSSLADLYDPLSMPPVLVKAHKALDAAVDKCYRKEAFKSELERVEYLFGLYEEYTAGLTAQAVVSKGLRRQK
jgi:hypothetical protein